MKGGNFDATVVVELSKVKVQLDLGPEHYQTWNQLYREIATKWILNATTTGAHVLKGKIYQNIMVDVKVRYALNFVHFFFQLTFSR